MIELNEDFEAIMPTPNNDAGNDLSNWYKGMANPTEQPAEVKKVNKPSQSVSDLMIYAIQLRCYANFITSIANSIESDIKMDIEKDNTILPATVMAAAPEAAAPVMKPLSYAIKNRDSLITAASNITELSRAVDSILARVKD